MMIIDRAEDTGQLRRQRDREGDNPELVRRRRGHPGGTTATTDKTAGFQREGDVYVRWRWRVDRKSFYNLKE